MVESIRFGDRVQVQTMLISLREKNSNIKIWKIIRQDFKAETNEHSFYNLFVVLLTTKPPEMLVRI